MGMKPETKEKIRNRVEDKLRPLTLPNFLTLIRMAIIPFFVLAVIDSDFRLALWTFLVAGLTDALDGWMARRFDMESVFGAYLDPIADKLLIVTAYVSLTVPMGHRLVIPLWLAILALARDFLIMTVALILYVVEGVRRFPPSPLGKATTFIHVLTICVVLLGNLAWIPDWVPPVCFYTAFILVILSGFNYIYRASYYMEEVRKSRVTSATKRREEDQNDG